MKTLQLNQKKGGFSLVELTIVVVILGVLATFAVPRFMRSVERSKAAEAFNYCENIRSSQGAYQGRNSEFAKKVTDLDVTLTNPQYFTVGSITSSDWNTKWEIKLTRAGASGGYGAYTVVFDQDGFNKSKSSIVDELLPSK